MINVLTGKILRHQVGAVIVWIIFCVFLILYNLGIYSYLDHNPEYLQFLMNMPWWIHFGLGAPGVQSSLLVWLFLLTSAGFTIPVFWSILTIRMVLNETAQVQENRALFFLLIHPVSRSKIYITRIISFFMVNLIQAIILGISLLLVFGFANVSIDWPWLLKMLVMNLLFMFWMTSLVALLGSIIGKVDLSSLWVGGGLLGLWVVEGLTRTGFFSTQTRWGNLYGFVTSHIYEKPADLWIGILILAGFTGILILTGLYLWQKKSFAN